VVNFELLPKPPSTRAPENPWPQYPRVFRVDYGHAEVQVHHGADPRKYCVLSKSFTTNTAGHVTGIETVQVEWTQTDGRWSMKEVADSAVHYAADLVLIAMGFLGPEQGVLAALEVEQDARTNIKTPPGKYHTNVPRVFAAGDCRRGQSLVVWGIQEGRLCAREVDAFLMDGQTALPGHGGVVERPLAFLERAALGLPVVL
jgi:glutamate synthase (NADPH/NADH)